MWWKCILVLAAMTLTTACASVPRAEAPPDIAIAAPSGFASTIRSRGLDNSFSGREADTGIAALQAAADDGSFDILAISGGGASGAYSAGVLVGLTQRGERPQYEVVTGVSAGALAAPFAFLGPDWDAQLTDAFIGGHTEHLLRSRGVGVLYGVGLNSGTPLRQLVERFITDDLVSAVAIEAARGRVLLVATTDLDRQETTLWNMGEIARRGGPEAVQLFRDVLVASASVPGLFPPVMISVSGQGGAYEEMHVDGGVTTLFFIAPEINLLSPEQLEGLRGANVFLLLNGQLRVPPRTTRQSTIPILERSFSTLMMHQTRSAIATTYAFASRQDMTFQLSVIPSDYADQDWLDFAPEKMRPLFELGATRAAEGRLWLTAAQALEQTPDD